MPQQRNNVTKTQPMQDGYVSLLLRLWPATENGWCGSIENVHTGELRHFALPEQLLSHLYAHFSAEPDPTQNP